LSILILNCNNYDSLNLTKDYNIKNDKNSKN
jgi:hypothetical protein